MGNQTSSSKLDEAIDTMFEKLKHFVQRCAHLETVIEKQLEQIALLEAKIASFEGTSVNRLLC
jgi:hypothetical protein